MAQPDSLAEQQILEVCNLKQSCQQTEDALSQGMEKLQETVSATIGAGQLGEGSYIPQLATAMEKLEALVSFVNQVIIASSHSSTHEFIPGTFQK